MGIKDTLCQVIRIIIYIIKVQYPQYNKIQVQWPINKEVYIEIKVSQYILDN